MLAACSLVTTECDGQSAYEERGGRRKVAVDMTLRLSSETRDERNTREASPISSTTRANVGRHIAVRSMRTRARSWAASAR